MDGAKKSIKVILTQEISNAYTDNQNNDFLIF